MKEELKKNIVFILYMLIVLAMAVIYFSVPERVVFMENQIKWWSELWDIVKTLGK